MQSQANDVSQPTLNFDRANHQISSPNWTDLASPTSAKLNATHSLVIINSDVAQIDQLKANVIADDEVVVLDSAQDGVAQISAILAQRSQLSSLHIVSHGASGSLHLGNTDLTLSNLSNYSNQLSGWASAFTESGDILLYGCDVASGGGTQLVKQISALTATDVAASVDKTGNAQLGGNWTLEYNVGTIDTALAFRPELFAAYNAVLAGDGLKGEYYDNQNFTNLKVTRVDATVNFNWNTVTPDPTIAPNTFSVRWTGQVQALYNETYTFYTYSDDGVRLSINGQSVINNFIDHAPTENNGTVTLVAGQRYDLQLEYYQGGGGATSQLSWSSASQTKQIIPQAQLYSSSAVVAASSTIALASNTYTVDEGGGAASIAVTRTGNTTGSASVQYRTTAGTATAGTDYTEANATLTFAAGETSKTIAIPIGDDKLVESNETFTLALSAPTGATLGAVQTATVTIVDNDIAPGGGTGTGLKGEYYDNQNFTNLKLTRVDPTINFNWNTVTPDPLIAPNTFSVRWSGQVQALYSETYTFYTYSDDGIRLTINGQSIVNNFIDHAPTENNGTITLVAGQRYDIQVEYYQGGGGATSQLSWSSASQVKQIIPTSQLYNNLGSDVTPPSATIGTAPAPTLGSSNYDFTVTYSDDVAVNVATLDSQDIGVTGPGVFNQLATLVSVNTLGNGSPRTATYRFTAPGGTWDDTDNGTYTLALRANQVSDAIGNFALAKTLGTVAVNFTPSPLIMLTGTDQADTLVAPDGQNYLLNGKGGNDKVTGGAGNDTLVGSTGNDTLDGGGGINTVSYADALNGVTVNLATGIANRVARILPLGDSITTGISEGVSVTPEPVRSQTAGGYRTVLWQDVQQAGITLDFVGGQSNGPTTLGDKDNEGHPGKTIAFISDNVLTYLGSAKPDAVLLMIGTNDTFATQQSNGTFLFKTANQMATELGELIDKIIAFSPDVKLFVASIPPILPNADERLPLAQQPLQQKLAIDYNNLLPGLVAQKQAAGAKVEFVDMRSSLTVADIVPTGSSGVHPTQAGYTKIGNLWYNALNTKLGTEQGTYKVDRDTLINIQNIQGSTLNDTLLGDAQSNVITGGLGADNLTGGGGADTFAYKSFSEGSDTITDFGSDDKFRLSAAGFGGLTMGINLSLATATTGMLVNGNAATSAVATFFYSNGVLKFDADGTGSGQAVTIATLTNGPASLNVNQFEITA